MTETVNMESTLFPVREVPIFKDVVTHNMGTHDKNGRSGYKFIVKEDDGSILSCMTDDYKVVSNQELMDVAVPILNDYDAELREAISLGDGQKSVWKWIIPDIKIEVDEHDLMNPEIIIKNSYDGSLQVHILAGAFRLVCSNGLIIGITLGKKNYRHFQNNSNLDKLDDAIEQTINHTKRVGDEFPILKEKKLKETHILKLVELFPSTMSEFIVDYLVTKKPENYWDLLNCATWIATHKMNRKYQSTHNLESQIYPNISKWANKASA